MAEKTMEQILDQMAKVLELEKRAATPEEAEAASAGFTRLLTRYNLDQLDVRRRLGDRAQPMQFVRHDLTDLGKQSWQRMLIGVVAANNGCLARYFLNTRDAVLLGPADMVPVVVDLYRSLARTVVAMADRAWDALTVANTTRSRWKTAYLLGCVAGIGEAMERANAEQVASYTGGSALVVAQQDALEREMTERLGTSSRGHKLSFHADAYARGYYDGLDVNVAQRGELAKGA